MHSCHVFLLLLFVNIQPLECKYRADQGKVTMVHYKEITQKSKYTKEIGVAWVLGRTGSVAMISVPVNYWSMKTLFAKTGTH